LVILKIISKHRLTLSEKHVFGTYTERRQHMYATADIHASMNHLSNIDSQEGYSKMGQGRLDCHMKKNLPKNKTLAPAVETIKTIISLIATCIGLAIIIIGLKYAMDIFQLIFTILKSPTYLTDPIQQITEIIGGSASDRRLEGGTVFLAKIVALTVYCCGALLCAWLTLALMHTGAKIVSLNIGDRNAVKKLLQSAFGKSLQPKATVKEDDVKTRDTSRSQP
jgi:hypothetical protein